MHYFKLNIGDYHKKAGRLSMLEHGAYTLLMHSCYDRERFPSMEEALDWCWARTEQEIAAVQFVLGKFFTLVNGLYMQERIADEVAAFHDKSLKNKEIALAREENRRTNRARNVHDSLPDEHGSPPNQEPRTNNQEPLGKNSSSGQSPDGADGEGKVAKGKGKRKQPSEEDLKAAQWIFSRIRKMEPTAKEPNFNTWGNEVRLMREIDKRTHAEICELFKWANQDSFWKANILSPGTLRDKWTQLSVKRSEQITPTNQTIKPAAFDPLAYVNEKAGGPNDRSDDCIDVTPVAVA